jgi:hypothetical protein
MHSIYCRFKQSPRDTLEDDGLTYVIGLCGATDFCRTACCCCIPARSNDWSAIITLLQKQLQLQLSHFIHVSPVLGIVPGTQCMSSSSPPRTEIGTYLPVFPCLVLMAAERGDVEKTYAHRVATLMVVVCGPRRVHFLRYLRCARSLVRRWAGAQRAAVERT